MGSFSWGKIIGDLIGGVGVKLACCVGAYYVSTDMYAFVKHAFDPVNKALGG